MVRLYFGVCFFVILVEQNISEALKISDRTYIMMNGAIAYESRDSIEILKVEILEKIFFGGWE